MRLKTFETLIGTICMPLCADVHPHHIFFCKLFISKSDVRMPSFLSHCRIPVWWWVNEVIAGAVFCSIVCCNLLCNALWLTIFVLLRYLVVLVIWTTSLRQHTRIIRRDWTFKVCLQANVFDNNYKWRRWNKVKGRKGQMKMINAEQVLTKCLSRSAMSNRNCLLSQKLCHYLNVGRTLDGLFWS